MNCTNFVVAAVLLAANCFAAREMFFEFEQDENYPQLAGISDVRYFSFSLNKFAEISYTMTIFEQIEDGTKVSITQ